MRRCAHTHLKVCFAELLHRPVGIALVNSTSRPPRPFWLRGVVAAGITCRRMHTCQILCARV